MGKNGERKTVFACKEIALPIQGKLLIPCVHKDQNSAPYTEFLCGFLVKT